MSEFAKSKRCRRWQRESFDWLSSTIKIKIISFMRVITKIRSLMHTLETKIQANQHQRKDIFQRISHNSERTPLKGSFDQPGFRGYFNKNRASHFKPLLTQSDIKISAIGVGTYKGSLDEKDDLRMFNGLVDSLNNGCNVLDSCRNFRGGRSEIVAGHAINYLIAEQGYARNNFFLSSKAGYVRDNLPSSVDPSEVVNDHCVHPNFLKAQLEQSLKHFGVQTLDVYFLNNFAESQKQQINEKVFSSRLENAFKFLEGARADGKIKSYGLSSWQSFRLPQGDKNHVNLEKIIKMAQKVGGKNHGFKYVQMPINILMPQAFAEQYISGKSFLSVAEQLKINVISNSPLLSGSLTNIPMPANLLKCNNNGAKHLQLIRSIPSKALVCTLVGQKLNRHVKKNLEVLSVPSLDEGEWLSVFVPSNEAKAPQEQRETL